MIFSLMAESMQTSLGADVTASQIMRKQTEYTSHLGRAIEFYLEFIFCHIAFLRKIKVILWYFI